MKNIHIFALGKNDATVEYSEVFDMLYMVKLEPGVWGDSDATLTVEGSDDTVAWRPLETLRSSGKSLQTIIEGSHPRFVRVVLHRGGNHAMLVINAIHQRVQNPRVCDL